MAVSGEKSSNDQPLLSRANVPKHLCVESVKSDRLSAEVPELSCSRILRCLKHDLFPTGFLIKVLWVQNLVHPREE